MVRALQSDNALRATCPNEGTEFRLADALIFYGDELPDPALQYIKAFKEETAAAKAQLEVTRRKLTLGFTEKSVAIKLGKTVEKVIPALSGFPYKAGDCRPVFDPIDYVVFPGLAAGKPTIIDFVDVKTGGSRLSAVQRQIRDAVNDGKVGSGPL